MNQHKWDCVGVASLEVATNPSSSVFVVRYVEFWSGLGIHTHKLLCGAVLSTGS